MRNIIEKLSSQIIKFLSSRVFFVATILLFQLFLITLIILGIGYNNRIIATFLWSLNILLIFRVINQFKNTSYKLVWILIIGVLPFFGGIIYLIFAEKKVPKALRGKITDSINESKSIFLKEANIDIEDDDIKQIFKYVKDTSYYPYYKNTTVKYLKIGEIYFEELLKEIKLAKHFIFVESFIIKEGYMLNKLIEAFKECKARNVKIYLMYDDGGCITCLPDNFKENMEAIGIKCVAFSPISIRLSLLSKSQNRSHRKIIVIDNRVAFTGGFNIADEYINRIKRFGHWKDTGIMFKGDAVWNYTLMFIQFYNASVSKNDKLNYIDFKYRYDILENDNLVLPFADSPTDENDIMRSVHYSFITHAKKYIYIHTPYLILDYDLVNALCIASKSGVEVIITVPHIPDKKTVFLVTKSHYKILIEAGVKIYEYSKGFIHSKLFIIDDKLALVGTSNMDYRSYYLNYECGVLVAQDKEIFKMKQDYEDTLKVSELITLKKAKNVNFFIKIIQAILNVFAPLM